MNTSTNWQFEVSARLRECKHKEYVTDNWPLLHTDISSIGTLVSLVDAREMWAVMV